MKVQIINVFKDENGEEVHKVYHKPTYRSYYNKLYVVSEGFWETVEQCPISKYVSGYFRNSYRVDWTDEPNELFKSFVDDVLKNLRSY